MKKKNYVAMQQNPYVAHDPLDYTDDYESFDKYGILLITDGYRNLKKAYDHYEYISDLVCTCIEEYFFNLNEPRKDRESATTIIRRYFTIIAEKYGGKFDTKTIHRITKCFNDYKEYINEYNCFDMYFANDLICDILTALTGRNFDQYELTGCCQGDFIDIIVDTTVYNKRILDQLECEFFDTGEFWEIYSIPDDIEIDEKAEIYESDLDYDGSIYIPYGENVCAEYGIDENETIILDYDTHHNTRSVSFWTI